MIALTDQPDADWLATFTILAREAYPELRIAHDRMGIILPANDHRARLDRTLGL